MILQGNLIAETPIYRGNARKTLFTRDGDGTQRLVSLAGEIAGTAEALMDAFIGKSRSGKNTGLLNQMWQRLYGAPMPESLITRVECRLQEASYPRDHLFDLRMGIKLDEDRWAAEANANYKMETLYRHSVFDLKIYVDHAALKDPENAGRLYYVLQELKAGRFWFGAGKSKGLGRCRVDMEIPFSPPKTPPETSPKANHLTLSLTFNAVNPVLVGWNWGKVDPEVPAFASVDGAILVESMRNIPEPVRGRLALGMAGPILSPEDFKRKLAEYLPRTIAAWLVERSSKAQEGWIFPSGDVDKLGKGKYAIPKKAMARILPLVDRPFPSREAAETAFNETMGKDARKYRRVLKVLKQETLDSHTFDEAAWNDIASALGLDVALTDRLAPHIQDENAMAETLAEGCQNALLSLYEQTDRQIRLLQSDSWVEEEISIREEHIRIKTMLRDGRIDERQWGDPDLVPEGIRGATWRDFMDAHRRVQYRHMVHPMNLDKSITNDQNFIDFLKSYRNRTRQELAQPYHTDFRAGGPFNRAVSRRYGKPYDTVFMRMLSWAPASREQGAWEIYIPGSTLKGAFRKRASQVLKTIWGATAKTSGILDRLFGAQGRRGRVFFSDAYLIDPQVPDRAWCSMDGVRMDPSTGCPVEEAKTDFLFAYGEALAFHLRLDIQDIGMEDEQALSLLAFLIQDFQRGDIVIGGQKTSGFGWVRAAVDDLSWMTADPDGIGKRLFGKQELVQEGIWYRQKLEGNAAKDALQHLGPLTTAKGADSPKTPPRAAQGFISHRAFGGHCGTLMVEAEILTPVSVKESGEPSCTAASEDGPINGWDFFSVSPPESAQRASQKVYALPSKSLKGMVRHLYAIASDSSEPSVDIGRLNPVDGLFGWVGKGPNQALMGRIAFSLGLFEYSELSWFEVPFFYGNWQYREGRWQNIPGSTAQKWRINRQWRLFPHAPLAPCVTRLDEFRPNTPQASYFRAILPGSRCRFSVRFWNLDQEELQRLIWCLVLEDGLAHKMGQCRYLGFGSLRLRLLPDSFLIDWASRYAGEPETSWRRPIRVDEWRDLRVIAHAAELQKALNAEQL